MTNKYIEPSWDKDSFTCPHCGAISLMHFHCISYIDKKVIGFYEEKHEGNSWVQVATCHNCAKHIVWVDNIYAYPDIVAEDPNPDMPEEVKLLYNEAGLIYNKSPRAACALLRLAIDRLCNELGETDRDINKNIGALVKKGLPESVQKALDVVRVVGNKAVHPGQIAFDVDDKATATMLMRLINIIVERMITEPYEIDSLYQGLPDSVRESIDRRDK
ncbi:MAG: DUF4145 domain-containing protein [Bacteroidaceae bacterium]|nr:DUF4145 domain-containing protein [Bacteroidaceae bacterium]